MAYDAVVDAYCYKGTTVLKNRLRLTDQAALDAYEIEVTTQRASEPLPAGRLGLRHYLAIHRHLFQDVYAWAGRIRTVRIAKDGSMFCYPEQIEAQLNRIFAALRAENFLRDLSVTDFARRVAHVLAELNAIHAFRDGNGRTQLAFAALLAARAGHPLDLGRLVPDAVLTAMIKSFRGDEEPLVAILANLIHPR